MKMDVKNEQAYTRIYKFVKSQCKSCGVKLISRKLPGNFGGTFDEETKTLEVFSHVIINNSTISALRFWERATILLHEMVHMWQWFRKDKIWNLKYKDGITNYSDIILEYTYGKYFPKNDLIQSSKYLMALEWEAEYMSAQLARSMGLEFPYARYMRGAQLYVYSYYTLAISGMLPDYKNTTIMRKLIKQTDIFSLTEGLANSMIEIMMKNRENCTIEWEGKKCIKHYS